MKVFQRYDAIKEVIVLEKKHRDIWQDIAVFERLLVADVTTGHDRYGGLKLLRDGVPPEIYKARVHCPIFGKGKQSGLRYIYERIVLDGDVCSVLLTIYLHQEGDKEHDVVRRVKVRFASYSTDNGGWKSLERSGVN